MFLVNYFAVVSKKRTKVLQKMHIRKKSEKYLQKMIDYIYLIDLLPFIGSLLVYGWR